MTLMSDAISDERLHKLVAMETNERIGRMTKDEHDSLIAEVIAGRTAAASAAIPATGSGETGWQDIATAPKDGAPILMGKWHNGERYWIASGCIEGEEFWCDFADDYFDPCSHQNPTHWRPAPTSPAETQVVEVGK